MSWNNQNQGQGQGDQIPQWKQKVSIKPCSKCPLYIKWDLVTASKMPFRDQNGQTIYGKNAPLALDGSRFHSHGDTMEASNPLQQAEQSKVLLSGYTEIMNGQQQQPAQQPQQTQFYSAPNPNNYTGGNPQPQQPAQQDYTNVNRESLQDILSEIQYLKSDLSQLRQMLMANNDQLIEIVNNWIQHNPIQNGLFQFIDIFKQYLPPPQLQTADKLVRDDSMNSDDINPLPNQEYDASK